MTTTEYVNRPYLNESKAFETNNAMRITFVLQTQNYLEMTRIELVKL